MKWTPDGGMEPFQFVAPPRGHAAIRPYNPDQPSPPRRPVDFTVEEAEAAMTHRDDPRDPTTEAAMREQQQGASEGQMARYGVRVLPPRDHRHGWDHPYSRPGGPSGKAGGKSGKGSNHSGKGGIHSGKGDHNISSSSSNR